jgi:hypothetical protein
MEHSHMEPELRKFMLTINDEALNIPYGVLWGGKEPSVHFECYSVYPGHLKGALKVRTGIYSSQHTSPSHSWCCLT